MQTALYGKRDRGQWLIGAKTQKHVLPLRRPLMRINAQGRVRRAI